MHIGILPVTCYTTIFFPQVLVWSRYRHYQSQQKETITPGGTFCVVEVLACLFLWFLSFLLQKSMHLFVYLLTYLSIYLAHLFFSIQHLFFLLFQYMYLSLYFIVYNYRETWLLLKVHWQILTYWLFPIHSVQPQASIFVRQSLECHRPLSEMGHAQHCGKWQRTAQKGKQ